MMMMMINPLKSYIRLNVYDDWLANFFSKLYSKPFSFDPPFPEASSITSVLKRLKFKSSHVLNKLNGMFYFLDISKQFLLPHPLRSDFPPQFIPLLLILRTYQ